MDANVIHIGFDTNGDGALTSLDDHFGSFVLWADKNGNGISDKGELSTLSEAGVASIDLEIFDKVPLDSGSTASQVLGRSTVSFTDGRQVSAYDVALEADVQVIHSCGCPGSLTVVQQDLLV